MEPRSARSAIPGSHTIATPPVSPTGGASFVTPTSASSSRPTKLRLLECRQPPTTDGTARTAKSYSRHTHGSASSNQRMPGPRLRPRSLCDAASQSWGRSSGCTGRNGWKPDTGNCRMAGRFFHLLAAVDQLTKGTMAVMHDMALLRSEGTWDREDIAQDPGTGRVRTICFRSRQCRQRDTAGCNCPARHDTYLCFPEISGNVSRLTKG